MAYLSILILTTSCYYYFEGSAILSVADKMAFCIPSKTWVAFRPTSDCTLILGDQGQLVGAEKKSKQARTKIGRGKVKNENKNPWDSSFNRPVPKPLKILACDWAQKYFFVLNQSPALFVLLSWLLIRRCSPSNSLIACSPFIYLLLLLESFPRSKSAIETRTIKPRKKKKL